MSLTGPTEALPNRSETRRARRLTELRPGEHGRLLDADLSAGDRALLRALGLGRSCAFRLCQAGSPWIVQVRGTRIGLADEVARRLRVVDASLAH